MRPTARGYSVQQLTPGGQYFVAAASAGPRPARNEENTFIAILA